MLSAANVNPPFYPPRWWWVVLIVILIAAGALRYTGYNFSLPYIDHPDEPNYSVAGRMIIDSGSAKPLGMHGYPPGIIALNYVLLRFFHDPATPPSSFLWIIRLIAITVGMGTLICVALIGYHLGSPLGGLLAAGMWAVTTIIVEFSRYGTSDPFVTFFTILAFCLALAGTRYDRDCWTKWSITAVMLAVIFKYQAVFMLPLVLLMPLWRLHTLPGERRRILKTFRANVITLILFFAWLFLLYPAAEASQSPNWAAAQLGVPTPDALYSNLRTVIEPLGAPLLWLPALVGLALWFLPPLRGRVWGFGLGVALLGVLGWHVGVSIGGGEQGYRQFIAEVALLMTLQGVGLAAWALVIARLLERFRLPVIQQRTSLVGALAVVLIVGVLFVPEVRGSIANAREHTLHDRRNDLAQWIDTTLMPAPHVANQANHKTLNGAWGGYAGKNDFPLVEVANLGDRTVEEWRDMGALYIIASVDRYEQMQETAKGRAQLDQMLLLKTYEKSSRYRGPSMVVLRLFPIQHHTEGQLGTIRLVGYDIDKTTVKPGESLTFTYYWQASITPAVDYTVFNHLVPLNELEPVAQIDGLPMPDARRPTSTWSDDEETLISRPFTMFIPANVPPGAYRLLTGFYRPDTGERLRAINGNDSLLVTRIVVE